MASASDHLELDLELDESKLQEGAEAVLKYVRPEWKNGNLKFKVFTDGISNKLIGAWNGDDKHNMVLVRIFGRKTELIVDRKQELRVFKVLHKAGLGPQLYATFKNGISYGFMPGCILSKESVRSDNLYPVIAREMARLHYQKPTEGFSQEPSVFLTIRRWLSTIPKKYSDPKMDERYAKEAPTFETIEKELKLLEDHLIPLKSPVVFCHNDILLANVIHDEKENKVYFIDYEYASFNYQGFDIGNHFDEYAGVEDVDYNLYPGREYQLKWLRVYLDVWRKLNGITGPVTDTEVEKLYVTANKFSLLAHFFWGVWGLLQSHFSAIDFDFLGYGVIRLNEYFKNKDKFLALEMPE